MTTIFTVASVAALAAEVTILNVFSVGTPAIAADVNGNFNAIRSAVNDNDSRIAILGSQLATLQSQLANAIAINQYLSLQTLNGQPAIRFSGVNVQIVNGTGQTTVANGTGNLIVGYDRPHGGTKNFCSIGATVNAAPVNDQTTCISLVACGPDRTKVALTMWWLENKTTTRSSAASSAGSKTRARTITLALREAVEIPPATSTPA